MFSLEKKTSLFLQPNGRRVKNRKSSEKRKLTFFSRKDSFQLALPDKIRNKVAEIDEYKIKNKETTKNNKKSKPFT